MQNFGNICRLSPVILMPVRNFKNGCCKPLVAAIFRSGARAASFFEGMQYPKRNEMLLRMVAGLFCCRRPANNCIGCTA